jgi:hypothetical protein
MSDSHWRTAAGTLVPNAPGPPSRALNGVDPGADGGISGDTIAEGVMVGVDRAADEGIGRFDSGFGTSKL